MAKKALNRRHSSLTGKVLKAMSIFGGVQGVGIICSVIRTKLVAVWIGATGVGIFGLYNSVIEMIASLAHLGIRNSAVRDIAQADKNTIGTITRVVRRWASALGLFSAILTIALAIPLSEFTFGDKDHSINFVILSITLLLTSLTNGELAILQGKSLLKKFANASLWGSVIGLAVSIPLFYYLREDSIIPSILSYAIATFAVTLFLKDKDKSPKEHISAKQTLNIGKGFIILGIYMTVSSFESMLSNYIFLSYLNTVADTATVGYYNAGYTLFNKYVGLVFTAISVEYYPRLVSAIKSKNRTQIFVCHEMSLSMWILSALVTLFISCSHLIVNILYTTDFEIIIPFVIIGITGTIFRAVSWCMSFVIIAKGDGITFIITDTISNIIGLVLNIFGYKVAGLEGLGIAYCLWYALYTIIIYIVYHYRYKMTITKPAILSIISVTVISAICAILFLELGWITSSAITIIAFLLSFKYIKKLLK